MINALCYHYPSVLKNEIEFLFKQIYGEDSIKYEKEFSTGKENYKKRFKIIVEKGEVML